MQTRLNGKCLLLSDNLTKSFTGIWAKLRRLWLIHSKAGHKWMHLPCKSNTIVLHCVTRKNLEGTLCNSVFYFRAASGEAKENTGSDSGCRSAFFIQFIQTLGTGVIQCKQGLYLVPSSKMSVQRLNWRIMGGNEMHKSRVIKRTFDSCETGFGMLSNHSAKSLLPGSRWEFNCCVTLSQSTLTVHIQWYMYKKSYKWLQSTRGQVRLSVCRYTLSFAADMMTSLLQFTSYKGQRPLKF